MLELSASKEVDILSTEVEDVDESSPHHVPDYEDLVEVVTRAVERINISWPCERQEVQIKSKLDEHFLMHRGEPWGLPFFPDLHDELCKSWSKPHTSCVSNPPVWYYSNIVEEALATYLSPDTASSLKAPALPTKPCRITSELRELIWLWVGLVLACILSILQAYQADLFKHLDEGDEPMPDDITELRKAADLSLHVTKEMACAISRSIVAMVTTERQLWLNLSGIREKRQGFSP